MLERQTVLNIVHKLKKSIHTEINNENIDIALELIFNCADILYNTNIYYYDEELEDSLKIISQKLNLSLATIQDKDILVYYDGFGLNDRGLVQVYLKALCQLKKVVYVTYEDRKDMLPDVLRILKDNDCKAVFINRKKKGFKEQVIALNKIIMEEKPSDFFFYAPPYDVVGTVVMNVYERVLKRYQINLTDHAFWLGAKCIDKCIEFRDYGASISKKYRGISEEKIVKLPFYPEIHREREFQGFPFEVSKGQKVFFSGGALYKTLGEDNTYYEMVDHILSSYKDVIFWYAGSGDDTKLKKILVKYPDRAFYTAERSDLFQVIEHSRFYLSTYPMCGGLMHQFATCAGRVPVTLRLRSNESAEGLLLRQDELHIEFDQIDDLYKEVDRLLLDDEYFNHRKEEMLGAVITAEKFTAVLHSIIIGNKDNLFDIKYNDIDTVEFREQYLKRLSFVDVEDMLVNKYTIKSSLKYTPIIFLRGAWRRLQRKIFIKIYEWFDSIEGTVFQKIQ